MIDRILWWLEFIVLAGIFASLIVACLLAMMLYLGL